jgi:uncharacterized protein YajQ (UPF0234 family)
MPSFDFSSEADMAALHNAIDVTKRAIDNRYDFKGTSAKVELNEKDKLITLYGDSDFQLGQIKDLLFPAMEKKEKESTKRLEDQPVQRVSGNKVKQELKIRIGIESELAKKIVKLIKDSKSRCRPRSRATQCVSAAPSVMSCKPASPWSPRRSAIFRSSTAIFATDLENMFDQFASPPDVAPQ